MSIFHLRNNSSDDSFPKFTKPKIIGYFSLNSERSWSQDAKQLGYYYPLSKLQNKINFDLNQGIDNVIRKASNLDEKIDHLLRWIKLNSDKLTTTPDSKKWIDADFVIYRGQLTKIMKSLYDFKEGWILCAVKFKGTIYICSFDTDEDKAAAENITPQQKQFMSWEKPVNENEEFDCVFTTRLNDKKILYGAEVDGLYSNEKINEPLPLDRLSFVELKTSKTIYNNHQQRTLEKYKFLRWWCQSFLVGIEDILCGFRNDNGIIESIQQFQVSQMGRNYKHYWSAGKCMNLLDNFLQFVKNNVLEDYDNKIYVFERMPFEDIKVTTASPHSKYAFLPTWFTQQ
ncbi:hypothetical protein HCN44_005807 [Aphidius gifuensis]|uniref:Decapping nuclease n=1 Tax=Aphidius gifuensis TaxID=684658 RepID=A0A834XUJ7_APHGI|nr:hypothetical protein HCN44_005807 [Aphidius gifuensis]